MPAKRKASPAKDSTANLGFQAKLWLAADSRSAAETAEGTRSNNMDAAEQSGARQPARQGSQQGRRGGAGQYKHVVLGLIFLKYISYTAGKCRMANTEIRTRNARHLRNSTFEIRMSEDLKKRTKKLALDIIELVAGVPQVAEIESRATGTTFAEISKQNFRPIRVVLPPKELMAVFTAKVAPLFAQVTANLHQSRTLATLRDTLLPKLQSGGLSVAGLESKREAAR